MMIDFERIGGFSEGGSALEKADSAANRSRASLRLVWTLVRASINGCTRRNVNPRRFRPCDVIPSVARDQLFARQESRSLVAPLLGMTTYAASRNLTKNLDPASGS